MKTFLEILLAGCLLPSVGSAQAAPGKLTELSLEQLMSTEVTSVSKHPESLFQTASAIYVITREDIARSGMTSVPELLRMVPGVQVARITSNTWAISSRGFNSKFANKMLVLVDGRNTYNQLYSGVFWDVQDMLLEDIERIEVIRGPGGSVWGANAVNGVINIITKRAQDTQGGLLTTTVGTEERPTSGIRYGGRLGPSASYRIYAKYFDRDSFEGAAGQDGGDAWHALRGGFRLDWSITPQDELTLHGDMFSGREGRTSAFPTLDPPYQSTVRQNSPVNGGNLLGRWTHTFSPRSDAALQVYLDNAVRDDPELRWGEDTTDVDFQHHLALGRNDLIWGLGYRSIRTSTRGSFVWSLNPVQRQDSLVNMFVQDEIVLRPDRLRLTVGTKLEHNDYSGFELEPSVRLLWTPSTRQTFWTAFSRAVRTPSRGESDLRVNSAVIPGADGTLVIPALFGNPTLKSEKVRAYEIGYRVRAGKRVFLDLATYFNSYADLRREEIRPAFLEATPAPLHVVVPFQFVNSARGQTYGLELAATWNPNSAWKVRAAYTFLEERVRTAWNAAALISEGTLTDSPKHQGQIGSSLRLGRRWDWTSAMYYVSPLNAQGVNAYVRLDSSLEWRWTENVEAGAGWQNLLRSWHREFAAAEFLQPGQLPRSAWGKITWRF